MAGSTFGTIFTITTWGESHGKAIGVVVDGCPAGLTLAPSDIQPFLNRRKPGMSKYTTPRKESDEVEILSGTFAGVTTGTPISMVVYNTDERSHDYGNIKDTYRPGHADYTYQEKYGIRDYRGGGRSSGRETIGRVAAGAIAWKLLNEFGITPLTYATSIGPIRISSERFDKAEINNNPLSMPDAKAAKEARAYLDQCLARSDSAGGVIECVVSGLPVGLGQPVFGKLDSELAKAVMSIGSVKGVEFGAGFQAANLNGHENNDSFTKTGKATNHAGGILGGISDGDQLVLRAAIKPTPSISMPQRTVTTDGTETSITIQGRHDPVIVPRAVVVVEAMVGLTLIDALLMNCSSKLENLKKIYDCEE